MPLMSWLRKGSLAQGLGGPIVARRVRGGRAPAGCYGIEIGEDGLFTLHGQGERMGGQGGGRRYWLHPGPYELRFAPHPEAPEAGVAVSLHAEVGDERISRFLASRGAEIFSREDLCLLARQVAGPHLLLPGMGRDEIEAVGGPLARFSNRMQEQGFSCSALRRVDLGAEVDTAALLLQGMPTLDGAPPDPAPGQRERRETEAMAVELGVAPEPPSPIEQRLPLWRLERLDDGLTARLQGDLEHLGGRVRRLLPGSAGDAGLFEALRGLERRLDRDARRARNLPALNGCIAGLRLGPAERRQRVAELRAAAGYLRMVKEALGELEGAIDSPLALPCLERLDIGMTGIEHGLRRRAGAGAGEGGRL